MRIIDSLGLDVGINVDAEIDIDVDSEVDSGVDFEGKIDCEEDIELKVEDEFYSYNGISVHKYVKYEVNININCSIDWYSDSDVGSEVGRGNNVERVMLVLKFKSVMAKELNYKLYMKLVMGMSELSKNVSKVSKMESLWGLVAVNIKSLTDVLVLGLVVMMKSNFILMMDKILVILVGYLMFLMAVKPVGSLLYK